MVRPLHILCKSAGQVTADDLNVRTAIVLPLSAGRAMSATYGNFIDNAVADLQRISRTAQCYNFTRGFMAENGGKWRVGVAVPKAGEVAAANTVGLYGNKHLIPQESHLVFYIAPNT